MYYKHRYNLIRFDLSTSGTAYKLFIKSLYDYVIVKEVTVSDVTTRSYFIGAKDLEANWTNKASLTYSTDIKGRKLLNEGQNWLAAAGQGDTFTGLLDEYSGATAAYSLRLLSNSYSGDAIVVRRSSDNATQSIGFVNNELDTTTLSTFCAGANGYVTKWYDQSGNGYDATQTTASEQPKIYDSVAGIVLDNGKPAVLFDGANDRLTGSDNGGLDNVRTGEFTYVGITRNAETTTFNYNTAWSLASFNNNGQGSLAMQFHSTLKSIGFHNTWVTPTQLALVDITSILNNQLLIFQTRDGSGTSGNGSTVTNNVNNLTTPQTQSFTSNPGTNYIIGSQSPIDTASLNDWKGTIQELIIYPTDESGNKTGIETNINDFYSIY